MINKRGDYAETQVTKFFSLFTFVINLNPGVESKIGESVTANSKQVHEHTKQSDTDGHRNSYVNGKLDK